MPVRKNTKKRGSKGSAEELRLSFIEHLAELRRRLIVSLLAVIVTSSVCYLYVDFLVGLLMRPAQDLTFVFLTPPELFLAYLKIAIAGGIFTASPLLLLEVWLFVRPALGRGERLPVVLAFLFGALLFYVGVTFAYLTILPMALRFFMQYASGQITPMFSIGSYAGFVSSILLAFGIAFELPIVVLLLTRLGILTTATLKRYRKYVLLIILIVAAFLTPPDVISQLLLTGPMYFLFEISILVSGIARPKRRSDEEEDVEEENHDVR